MFKLNQSSQIGLPFPSKFRYENTNYTLEDFERLYSLGEYEECQLDSESDGKLNTLSNGNQQMELPFPVEYQ